MTSVTGRSEPRAGLDALAARVAGGETMSTADAQLILDSHDLVAIGIMADGVRRAMHRTRTTFVRVFEIHAGAVPEALPRGLTAGELRIVGRPSSIEAAVDVVRAAAAIGGTTPLGAFSLTDLVAVAGSGAEAFRSLCGALREAGLHSVAELPVDEAGDDLDAVAWATEEARDAGLMVARLTVQQLPAARRIAVVESARALQGSLGGFRVFAPLPSITSPAEPSTGYDDVKQVALARILARNIDSIQVDWSAYGPKLAQVALTMGADDVDRVAAFDVEALGTRRSAIEEIRRNIRAAALDPVERNGRFEGIQ